MFEKWCSTCQREMKCHNVDGTLHCIGCKRAIGTAAEERAKLTQAA